MSGPRVHALLASVRRRLRFALAVRGGARGALLGTAVALVLILSSKVVFVPAAVPLGVAALALTTIAGVAWAAAARLSLPVVAAIVDRQAGLKERVATALELERAGEAASPFGAAILRQAEEACAIVRAGTLVPRAVPRELKVLPLLLLLAFGASLLPERGGAPRASDPARDPVDGRLARDLGVRARRLIDEARAARDAEAERVGRQMEALARDIEKRRAEKRDALARITAQKEELAKAALERRARADAHAELAEAKARRDLALTARKDASPAEGEGAMREAAERLAEKIAAGGDEARAAKDAVARAGRAGKDDPAVREAARRTEEAIAKAEAAAASGDAAAREQARREVASAVEELARKTAPRGARGAKSGGSTRGEAGGEIGETSAGESGSGEVPPEELAKAFESLEGARARLSGGEMKPLPESLRARKSQGGPAKASRHAPDCPGEGGG